MQFKRTLNGLTLIEILLSLVIASMILVFLVPQQLKYSHEQLVDKTVAEMNQIVLAARNYYQETRAISTGLPNSSFWPQNLTDLSAKSYLPTAALCSSWPSATASTACKNLAPYVIFPNNGSGQYDTTAPGIPANGVNKGGNFWGVSVTLPNAKIAEEVRQKLPFASRCAVDKLKSGVACSSADEGATVTAIVPRPALWPQQITNYTYIKDGLIQSVGSINMCSNNCTAKPSGSVTITMPTCDDNTTPVLFTYPIQITTNYESYAYFPGISLKTTKQSGSWKVQAQGADGTNKNSTGITEFSGIQIGYFTVCAPNGGVTNADPNRWDPSNFIGQSKYGVNW